MTGLGLIVAGDEHAQTPWMQTESREALQLADRLQEEFGVPAGVLEPTESRWLAWSHPAREDAPTSPPRVPSLDPVAIVREESARRTWLALRVPRDDAPGTWLALAAFSDESTRRPEWADRAVLAWGNAVAGRLALEGASGPNQLPRSVQVAEHLIRRLRISDPPERFQSRAASSLRDLVGVEVVAWVPNTSRDSIVVVGGVHGLLPEAYGRLAREPGAQALRIVNSPTSSTPTGLRRYVVATAGAEKDGGWLIAANPTDDRPFGVEADLISTVASLIGTQRCNARIYSDLKDLLFGVIRALTAAIDAKDPYTSGHSERVARIAVRISQELGMSPHEQGDLYLMGLLHDVGKIGVEDVVLKKPGKLTSDEYHQIQAHVRIGVHILTDLKKLHHLLPGVAYHHESLDGSGYPSGLRGEAIPLPARILAVADAFDAMSSNRPYRRRKTAGQIDDVFRQGIGTQWDSRVVQALFACRPDLVAIRQKGLGESLHQVINETLGRS
ncbi:MAG: hypothetical protein JWN86_3180 [Planctomycetota bacterium]|nr:hypothetical protein [Planctomycetota bacterium]